MSGLPPDGHGGGGGGSSESRGGGGGGAAGAAGRLSAAKMLRLGLLMAVTMTLHNLPEGFAVRRLGLCVRVQGVVGEGAAGLT